LKNNFYIPSFNSTLSKLINLEKNKSSDIIQNFYNSIYCHLFIKDNKDNLFPQAVELLYDPQKFKDIKRSGRIDSNCIIPLLFGYHYYLNILASTTRDGIYYQMYTSNSIRYISENIFPGKDTKYNLLYSNIKNHFKNKPDDGCYVCLSRGWYYHIISTGFPESNELNKICPKCGSNIGLSKIDNYFRIFKEEKENEELRKIKK